MSNSKSIESSRSSYYFDLAIEAPYLIGYGHSSFVDVVNPELLATAQLFQKEEHLAKKIADDNITFGYDTLEKVLQISYQVARQGYKTELLDTDELLEIIAIYKDLDPFETIVKIIRKHANPSTPYSAYELRVIAALNYLGATRSQQTNEQSH